jgi:hypothetical protein
MGMRFSPYRRSVVAGDRDERQRRLGKAASAPAVARIPPACRGFR